VRLRSPTFERTLCDRRGHRHLVGFVTDLMVARRLFDGVSNTISVSSFLLRTRRCPSDGGCGGSASAPSHVAAARQDSRRRTAAARTLDSLHARRPPAASPAPLAGSPGFYPHTTPRVSHPRGAAESFDALRQVGVAARSSERVDQCAADHHAVGEAAHRRHLVGARDAEAHGDRSPPTRRRTLPSATRDGRKPRPLPRHPRGRCNKKPDVAAAMEVDGAPRSRSGPPGRSDRRPCAASAACRSPPSRAEDRSPGPLDAEAARAREAARRDDDRVEIGEQDDRRALLPPQRRAEFENRDNVVPERRRASAAR